MKSIFAFVALVALALPVAACPPEMQLFTQYAPAFTPAYAPSYAPMFAPVYQSYSRYQSPSVFLQQPPSFTIINNNNNNGGSARRSVSASVQSSFGVPSVNVQSNTFVGRRAFRFR